MPSPSSLEPSAALSVRFGPGAGPAFAAALAAALGDAPDRAEVERLAKIAGTEPAALSGLVALLRGEGSRSVPREVVVVFGERLTSGPNGAAGAEALLQIAARLGIAETEGAGLLEIPAAANGRGLREAGVLPNAGPGFSEAAAQGRDAHAIAEALAAGELQALYLLDADPLGRPARRRAVARARWPRAGTVVAHASFLTEAIAEHADVVFPAEVYAEKEGTIVHPDGRLQRLRPAIARVGRGARRVAGHLRARAAPRARPRRAERGDGLAAAVRRGPVLRRPHARGDRRARRALAGALTRLRACPRAPRPGEAAPELIEFGDDPATLAEQREVAGFRSCGTRPRWSTRRRSPSCIRAAPEKPARSVPPLRGPSPVIATRRLLRALVDPDPQVDRDLRGRPAAGAVVLLAERKLLGRFQSRLRPNRVGPFGALQPLADILKLLTKEQFRPSTSIGFLFAIAPIISIVTAVGALAIIPFGDVQNILRHERRPLRHRRLDRPPLPVRDERHRLLRDHARRLVLGLEVLVPRRDARSRAADLLRGLPGARARRRDHHRADAVADRHRQRAERDVVLHPAVRRAS